MVGKKKWPKVLALEGGSMNKPSILFKFFLWVLIIWGDSTKFLFLFLPWVGSATPDRLRGWLSYPSSFSIFFFN
jgi:hypothetical protein